MSKKKAVNSKAEAANARKCDAKADRISREAREKEDQKWREAEGSKSRVAKKREEEAEKRAEAAARKMEARRLAEQEEKDLEKTLKKPVKKVTEAELLRRKEEQQAAILEEEKRKQSRTAGEKEYEKMILVSNSNCSSDDSVIDANTIEEAIAQMTVKENTLPPVMNNKHRERKINATQQSKKGNSLMRLARDDEERSLLMDVRRINLDKSRFEYHEDFSGEFEEDSYEDDYRSMKINIMVIEN
ncbi:hypothetical protein ACH5RR_000987 [Cinchona calisaya]|uniref:Uncharacterized protein n=1 Tax=Cinchona calisaya TaxID=153742 RepID=A0ABD3B2N8_9GENT